METIISAILGFLGVCITAGFGYAKWKKENKKAQQAESEMKFQRAALSFEEFLEEWAVIHHELKDLLETTCLDRFLILRAWNGHHEPRWTTAVFQIRLGNQEAVSYVHYELDTDYQSRIREISLRNDMTFSTKDLPASGIKEVYQAEGVKAAAWFLINEDVLENSGSKAVTYCSFATKSEEKIPDEVMTRCRILVGRLKGAALSFKE